MFVIPMPRPWRSCSSSGSRPRDASTSREVSPARCREGQNRLPGRANGALTAAVQSPGLMPTMSRRSGSWPTGPLGSGSTSSIASGSGVAKAARSFVVGLRPASGEGRRVLISPRYSSAPAPVAVSVPRRLRPMRPMEAGRLHVIAGPMFAGKTEELLRRVHRARLAGLVVEVIGHRLDSRGGTDRLSTHTGRSTPARMLERAEQLRLPVGAEGPDNSDSPAPAPPTSSPSTRRSSSARPSSPRSRLCWTPASRSRSPVSASPTTAAPSSRCPR